MRGNRRRHDRENPFACTEVGLDLPSHLGCALCSTRLEETDAPGRGKDVQGVLDEISRTASEYIDRDV